MIKVQDVNPITNKEPLIVKGYVDPFLRCITAPDHSLCSVCNRLIEAAFPQPPEAGVVVKAQFAFCQSLKSLGSETQAVLFYTRTKKLHVMSMSTVYAGTDLLPLPLISFSQAESNNI